MLKKLLFLMSFGNLCSMTLPLSRSDKKLTEKRILRAIKRKPNICTEFFYKLHLKRLIENSDVDLCDNSSRTLLAMACVKNNVRCMKILLKLGADIDTQDNSGQTPLHHVCGIRGDIEKAKLLVNSKADLNIKNNKGYTPLIQSVVCGNPQAAKFLIESGALTNLTDNLGHDALSYAKNLHRKKLSTVIKMLEDAQNG